MPLLTRRLPKLSHHRASGQAVVTICGRDHYLGPWKSKIAKADYDRLMSEYIANGNRLPEKFATHFVAELAVSFKRYAIAHYVDVDGEQTGEAANFDAPLKALVNTCATMLTRDFTVAVLKSIQAQLATGELSRVEVNRRVNKIRRIFRWGEAEGLVPPGRFHELQALLPLSRGRTAARETAPRQPVDEKLVAAVLPFMSPTVAAMVQIQLQSGLRPTEVCEMRGRDLETIEEGRVTIFRPLRHKTAHHGHSREAILDARSTVLVRSFATADPDQYLFSPLQSVQHLRERRNNARTTPSGQGNSSGSNRKRRPKRAPGDHYTANTYRQAVVYACRRAFPPPKELARPAGITHGAWVAQLRRSDPERCRQVEAWDESHRFFPYQLRHAAATRWRKTMTPDVVLLLLGDKSTPMVDLYARKNRAAAIQAVLAT